MDLHHCRAVQPDLFDDSMLINSKMISCLSLSRSSASIVGQSNVSQLHTCCIGDYRGSDLHCVSFLMCFEFSRMKPLSLA